MNAREYVTMQVERTRGQLRATAFLKMGNKSLRLRGKKLSEFAGDLLSVNKTPVELIDAKEAFPEKREILDGDIVSRDKVFTDSEGIIWEGERIRFQTPDSVLVTPEQYEYLKSKGLGSAQIFAEADGVPQEVKSVFKSMSRSAREARNDKAKEILYITFGELIWDMISTKKEPKKVKSPLFIMPIKEEITDSGASKFRLLQTALKENSVLRREVLKATGVNIYEGCKDTLPLQELEEALLKVKRNSEEYLRDFQVEIDAYHLCILDSHDEGVCQAVEKNIDSISRALLTRILSGEVSPIEEDTPFDGAMILPLPADESQKRVIGAVLGGESIYAPAPAGAGKSQTSVNIAANLAIKGKSVLVMSEKLAANEVFLEYAGKIGLDKYCLSVNSNMKTADIVKQIKSIAKLNRQYVHTEKGEQTLRGYAEAMKEYERLNKELYDVDPVLNTSLYELISTAVSADEIADFKVGDFIKEDYAELKKALFDTNAYCLSVMTDSEFDSYFYQGICRDPELDAMIKKALGELTKKGIDLAQLIRDNRLTRSNAAESVLANLARRLALNIIGEKDLCNVGNRRVKAVYKHLVDMHLKMQELYVSYLNQELSARVADNMDHKFIAVLDKLKVTKVTVQELFSTYGKKILSICPIVITTPTAASSYIYGTGMDDFHTMIIDEASQMQIISVLPYTDRVKQLVVFGDSMQLGITTTFMKKDVVPAEAVGDTAYTDRSVLQAVQGRLPVYGLKYHYRSGTEMLIHVSNKTCYDSLLETVPDIYTERSALPQHLGLEVIQVDPPTAGGKGCNESEALEIAARVQALREEYPDRSIGIIAFNEPQQELISDLLEERVGDYQDSDRLWVRSLENAQGKEADFVFISIGHFRRNADGSLYKGISEINREGGENRLNVLFTRARCKNYIVISFDYRELKKSDNSGIKRLYEYIDYAINGQLNERSVVHSGNADHNVASRMADMMESINSSYKTKTRMGSENMAVDIAIKENGNSCYSLGILMPSFRQTPQEAMTKVLVLERAGWHISPVSPIYFLTCEEAFRAQLEKDIEEPISFTKTEKECFDTDRRPERLFSVDELFAEDNAENEDVITTITEEDFLDMDLEACYEGAVDKKMWWMDMSELGILSKSGNTEATLVLLIMLRKRFVRDGNRRALLSNVSRLYSVYNERRAGFLFAQLLRIDDIGNNKKLIESLLREAYDFGIGGVKENA